MDNQFLISIGSPNHAQSTLMGGGCLVGKCVSKENPIWSLGLVIFIQPTDKPK